MSEGKKNKFNEDSEFNFHGGAVLADSTCGSVSLSSSFGGVLSVRLEHDPEWTMSGWCEPSGAYDGY